MNSVDVNFVAGQVNTLPVFVSGAGTTPLANAVEDVSFIISYNDLATSYGGFDPETGALTYQITSLPANSSVYKKTSGGSTTTFTSAPVDVNPGDSISWTPPLNADAVTQDIFTVKLKDGAGALSAADKVVQATVLPVNDTPVYGSPIVNLSNGSKNVNVSITHAAVLAAIPFSDVEGNGAEYRIESVGAGSLYQGATTTTAVVAQTTRLASATAGDKVSGLTWVPPSNGVGEFVIAQVRLCDASSCAATVRELKINVNGSNAAPTLDAAKLNIQLGIDAGTTGTQQNVPLTVTYETLKTLSGANDTDGTVVKMQITSLESGKLTVTRLVSGSYVTSEYTTANPPATPVNLDPGESVVWTPALNSVSVNASTSLAAFSFKSFDGVATSSNTAALKVYVDPVNQAPSMNTAASYNATRNTALGISFTDLADKLAVSDFEDVTGTSTKSYDAGMKFRIKSIINGSVSKGGTQMSVNDTFLATESVSYNAGNNVTGTLAAFTVAVEDKSGLGSSQIATVTVNVAGSNALPTLVGSAEVTLSAAGTQKQAYTLSYSTLAAAGVLNLQDTDSATKMFVITNISGGTLFNGATTVTAHTTAPNATPAPASTSRLLVGESLTFIPNAATVGATEILRIRGYDGEGFSDEVRVKVTFAPAYTVPTISAVSDFTGLTQNQAFTFTYDELKLKADEVSPDANVTYPVQFKITSAGSGVLSRTLPSASALSTNSVLSQGETYQFTPTSTAYGKFKGFGISVVQQNAAGSLESVNSVDVNFVASKVNTLPTFSASGTPLSGGSEDSPFVVSYNQLVANYGGTDSETGVLRYHVTALSNASASYSHQSIDGIGNRVVSALTAAQLPIDIGPGESIIYSPVLNDATAVQNIMSVKLKDGDNSLSAADRIVQVLVTSVNDAPTYGVLSALPSTTKNVTGGLTISYATLKTAVNVVDPDTAASSVEYRIESVNSGTLRGGISNSGSAISVTPSDTTTMPFLVSSGVAANRFTDLNWTPPLNGEGSFYVLTVRAFDGSDYAASAVKVQISVTPSNTPPTLNAGFTMGVASGTSGATQNGATVVSYDTLLSKTAASDSDENVVTFQVTYLESGSLTLSGTTVTNTGALTTPLSIPVGGSLVWRPAANATGSGASALNAFRVKAYDGALSSSTE